MRMDVPYLIISIDIIADYNDYNDYERRYAQTPSVLLNSAYIDSGSHIRYRQNQILLKL